MSDIKISDLPGEVIGSSTEFHSVFAPQEIKDLTLCTLYSAQKLRLDPKPDLTTIELYHLTVLMSLAANQGFASFDFIGYVKKHGLDRHVEITKAG